MNFNPRTIAFIAVALGITIGVGLMVNAYLGAQRTQIAEEIKAKQKVVPPTIPTARVLVAKKDLVVGTFVKREDLHWQLWPEESITPAYVTDSQILDATKSDQKRLTIEDFVGGVVRQPIAGGQPLVLGLVAKAGERGFLAAVLQPGMRAMSVPVSATSGISGFILPGDHVDILWDVKKSKKGHPFTQTLFRDIRVIAVDTKTSASGATPAKTLTLEFTPFQTEAMSLAQNMGGIEFTLRSIVPETDKDNVLEDADGNLLAKVGLGRSDGIEKGALLGPELLAVAKETEIKEVIRDSWTLETDLLYGSKTKNKEREGRGNAVEPTQVRQGPVPGGNQQAPKPGATTLPPGKAGEPISIVRGVKVQNIRVAKR
ncbi:MAG: Flp pilus assembly protein CpaB [Paracoccaceae bacterium]|nr:Flp pilus assembly protein CpaB [Paracoccaceae bacterium]